jgi:hypothetical protein
MNTILSLFGILLVTEIGYYVYLLIKKERRDQLEYEMAKLSHVEDLVPPSLWSDSDG